MAKKFLMDVKCGEETYSFFVDFKSTSSNNTDLLIMQDENSNDIAIGKETWTNRPWHRFRYEKCLVDIVKKLYNKEALDIVLKINAEVYSIEDAIKKFFKQLPSLKTSEKEETETNTPNKAEALAKELNISVEEVIPDENGKLFVVDGNEYLVLTDEEAEKYFDERIDNLVADSHYLEYITPHLKDAILQNCINEQTKREIVEDSYQYIYDMDEQEILDEAENNDVITQKEYKNYMEFGVTDSDIDNLKDELFNKFVENADIDDILINFEESQIIDFVDNDLAKEEIKAYIETNGSRGEEIAICDGQELELENDLYAYRIS